MPKGIPAALPSVTIRCIETKADAERGAQFLQGGIRMVANSDWPLESLARESGAEMAYRVSVNGTHVSVDGLSQGRRCSVQSEPPAAMFRRLLPDRRQYQLA